MTNARLWVPLGTGKEELNWRAFDRRDRHRDGQLPNRVNAIADSTMETERERLLPVFPPSFLPLPFMLILFSPLFVPGEGKTFCEAGAKQCFALN